MRRPGDPLDYELQAELANHYTGSMATGENLFSMQDAEISSVTAGCVLTAIGYSLTVR